MHARHAVDDRFGAAADAIHDHGASGGHRLDRDDPEVLDRGEDERERALEEGAHELVGHAPEQVHRHARVRGEGGEALALGTRPHDHDRHAEPLTQVEHRGVALVRDQA